MIQSVEQMNEVELYFVIDYCGGFIWRMNHDMADGRIPMSEHAAIDADIEKMRVQQLDAVRQLPRVGVAMPLDAENRPTPEYWTWYRTWDAWKKGMTEERWREVDAAMTRGLTADEISAYKTEAFHG